jgi:hypothetical protein
MYREGNSCRGRNITYEEKSKTLYKHRDPKDPRAKRGRKTICTS